MLHERPVRLRFDQRATARLRDDCGLARVTIYVPCRIARGSVSLARPASAALSQEGQRDEPCQQHEHAPS
jgi:hypothetical protein